MNQGPSATIDTSATSTSQQRQIPESYPIEQQQIHKSQQTRVNQMQSQVVENSNEKQSIFNNENNNSLGAFDGFVADDVVVVDDDDDEDKKHNLEIDQPECETASSQTGCLSLAAPRKTSKSIGPDRGLLFGLENLMKILDDLKIEYRSSKGNRQAPMEKAMENLYIPVVWYAKHESVCWTIIVSRYIYIYILVILTKLMRSL